MKVIKRRKVFLLYLHKGQTKSLWNIVIKCPVWIKRCVRFCRRIQTWFALLIYLKNFTASVKRKMRIYHLWGNEIYYTFEFHLTFVFAKSQQYVLKAVTNVYLLFYLHYLKTLLNVPSFYLITWMTFIWLMFPLHRNYHQMHHRLLPSELFHLKPAFNANAFVAFSTHPSN